MNLYIPEIGTQLRLTDYWVFHLFDEYRNRSLFKTLGEFLGDLKSVRVEGIYREEEVYLLPLPPGTILTVDRIYIRQGNSAFSSISFRLKETPHPIIKLRKKGAIRFWAKLSDVNKIECEVLADKVKAVNEIPSI